MFPAVLPKLCVLDVYGLRTHTPDVAGSFPYCIGRSVDWLFGGGASIAACALMLAAAPRDPGVLLFAIGILTWLLHWPHLSASFYRLHFPRAHAGSYPWTVWVAPGVVALGASAAIAAPATFAPAWVRVSLWWLSWHVAEQAAVLSEVYARRGGRPPEQRERLALRTACWALAAYHVAAMESLPGPARFFGVELASARLPVWLPPAAAAVAGLAFLGWLGLAAANRGNGRARALISFLPPAALAVWFFSAGRASGIRESLVLFHGLQYLLLCGSCQVSEAQGHRDTAEPGVEAARWGAVNLMGGAALGAALPAVITLGGADLPFAFGIIAASAQLYHFMADAVLWRLDDPRIAARLGGGALQPQEEG